METIESADGTPIAFDRSGAGPALILVTGALTDRSTPASLAAALARHFTVFTYDRRGRGDSGDTAPYAVEREIEDLGALITAAGGSAGVFGHSAGGSLALEAAAGGSAISRLAIYEPPYIVDDSRPRPEHLADRIRALLADGRRTDAMRLFFVEGVNLPEIGVRAMARRPAWTEMEPNADCLPYELAVSRDQRMPADRIAKIAIPALVLDGASSAPWARATVRAIADTLPGARHLSLPGQTHNAADDVLAPVVADFFTD